MSAGTSFQRVVAVKRRSTAPLPAAVVALVSSRPGRERCEWGGGRGPGEARTDSPADLGAYSSGRNRLNHVRRADNYSITWPTGCSVASSPATPMGGVPRCS
jgi:hypothetical protein